MVTSLCQIWGMGMPIWNMQIYDNIDAIPMDYIKLNPNAKHVSP